MSDSIERLVESFYQGFAGDIGLLEQAVTTDWEDIPLAPGQEQGIAGIEPIIEGVSKSFSNFEIVVHDIVDGRGLDGNGKIGVRAEMRGTHIGDMFGIPGTGQDVVIAMHEFHDVENGRLRRTWHLEDWLGFFVQVDRSPKIGNEQ